MLALSALSATGVDHEELHAGAVGAPPGAEVQVPADHQRMRVRVDESRRRCEWVVVEDLKTHGERVSDQNILPYAENWNRKLPEHPSVHWYTKIGTAKSANLLFQHLLRNCEHERSP